MLSRFRDSSAWKAVSDISVVAWIASTVGGAVAAMATWLHREPLYLVMFYGSAVFCLLSASSYYLSKLWRRSHLHSTVAQKPNLECTREYIGREVVVMVTNVGAIADVWASLAIDGLVKGRSNDIFARWAHTESARARIAKGQTCRLILATLKIDTGTLPTALWMIPYSVDGGQCGISEAHYGSMLIGNDGQAEDMHVYVNLFSDPDSESSAIKFHAVLHSKGAEFLRD